MAFYELRQYKVNPGKMAQWLEVMENDIIPFQVSMGMVITGSFRGSAEAFQSSLASQPFLILAALLAVYIILGVLYESFVHPLTILSTLPSAGIGAILFLWILGFDFSIMAMIGLVTSRIALIAASRACRCSSCMMRSTFSSTTMASSTTMPMASTMPNSVSVLIE